MKVSIILLTKNQNFFLKQCLTSIQDTVKNIEYEVIVLANNATSEIKNYLNYMSTRDKRIRPQYSNVDLGFGRANNMMFKQAKGDYILLLNDDTIPIADWLNQMIITMEEKENVGIVGAKLIYPGKNTIQHFGVVFDENKKPFHMFSGNQELDPRACVTREFKAVTFACALIKREVWEEVNGLAEDENDAESYYRYEDIDFCLKAGEKGYKIWCCATAVIGHYSTQTVVSVGKVKNIAKFLKPFVEKWKDKIEPDYKKYEEFPPLPHIMIGIPISETYDWCLDMLLNNLLNMRIYKGCISICFVINNSGANFHRRLLEWGKVYARAAGFRDVIYPKKMIFENDKNRVVVISRNLIKQVAKERNATHIYWWDCDVIIPPDTISKLFVHNAPISMATVWYKTESKKPMIFRKRKLIFDDFDKLTQAKNEHEMDELTTDRKSKARGIGPYYIAYECGNGKAEPIEKIDAGGLGACLMRTSVANEVDFESAVKNFGTEDLAYFYKLNKKGYDIVLDTTIKTAHLSKGGVYNAL